jgi:hypothetical protein
MNHSEIYDRIFRTFQIWKDLSQSHDETASFFVIRPYAPAHKMKPPAHLWNKCNQSLRHFALSDQVREWAQYAQGGFRHGQRIAMLCNKILDHSQ